MTLRNMFGSLSLETTQVEVLQELQTQQKNALTNAELRATPVVVDTNLVQPTTPLDVQPVSATSLPLPTGAATEATQTSLLAELETQQKDALTNAQLRLAPVVVDTQLSQPTTPLDTQPVSAASLPLPSGAATEVTLESSRVLLSAIEANQLPDNHQVTVSNQIVQPTTPLDVQPISATSLPLPTGAATEEKQLADNHNVQVSNFPATFPLSDAQVETLRTTKIEEYLNSGQAFLGGGKVSVTNNTAVLQLNNPVGSGKLIAIQQFSLTADENVDVRFIKDATVNSPTTRTADRLNRAVATTAVGLVAIGSTGVTGGTTFSPIGRLAANITVPYMIPIVLAPGQSAGATFTAGALTDIDCYASVTWVEIPI